MIKESLSQLEGDWGEVSIDAPLYLQRVYRLRNLSIEKLAPADIRLLVGQDVGLAYLLPIAFKILDGELLFKAEHYHGDLFAAVLRVRESAQRNNDAFVSHVRALIGRYRSSIFVLDDIDAKYAREAIEEAIKTGGWE